MDSQQIRRKFVEFFEKRGHKPIPSSSLVPHGDPTLLFTTAGMVQFKPYFMGLAEPPARRMVTVQKCFRTSDIDSVGDATHLTFFEMLGNFSVGDYFKKESIEWAWQLVTDGDEGVGLPHEKLWVSVYLDDDESEAYWRDLGVPLERIRRYGEEDNFWFSGDVGPCGPCSEIHYDYGPTPGCPECEAGTCHPQIGCGRFTELWNLVFTMYYQNEDGSRTELPQRNIDTGAGLERWASVLQGVRTVYETDLFRPLIELIEEISGMGPDHDGRRTGMSGEESPSGVPVARSKRIIAEHARAVTFLLADGVMPGNEGRGYVLRRILRRAIAYGRRLGLTRPFLASTADAVVRHYSPQYPELEENKELVTRIVSLEEEKFQNTLVQGEAQLTAFLTGLGTGKESRLPGVHAFYLYDTYGFPLELTVELAAERGFAVDEEGFEREMEAQRERARAAGRFRATEAEMAEAYAALAQARTRFVGYETMRHETSVLGIVSGGAMVDSVAEGEEAELVLHETPFYAEAGGQVGDTGEIAGAHGRFRVEDTQRTEGGLVLQRGRVIEGRIAVNDDVVAQVDAAKRWDTMRNHTATHLLHAALRRVVGPHARQAGSLVAPDRLRFDYTHIEPLKPEEVAAIESLVNEKIREDAPVRKTWTSYEEAMKAGVIALFGEKYAAEVRVIEVPEIDNGRYSAELCGGTHVDSTGQIGSFIIVGEESIGAGMRRIEALTGRGADEYVRERIAALNRLSARLGVSGGAAELEQRVESLLGETESLGRRVRALERELGRRSAELLADQAERVDASAVVAARVPVTSPEALREMGDWLRDHLRSAVIVLGTVANGRPSFLAVVTADLTERGLHAGELISKVAQVTGGGGGGRPGMAQAGGRDAGRLDEALKLARKLAVDGLKGVKGS
ncbi:MAG: alanine--tRNA ligase [Dehalococcoidia bacterium]|nr:alanine--tRNA ligase [Dehalococcoidia bacterium]